MPPVAVASTTTEAAFSVSVLALPSVMARALLPLRAEVVTLIVSELEDVPEALPERTLTLYVVLLANAVNVNDVVVTDRLSTGRVAKLSADKSIK